MANFRQSRWLGLLLLGCLYSGLSQTVEGMEPTLRDVVYAEVDGRALKFDLYRPRKSAAAPPLLIWVHGGAWRAGSKFPVPITDLVDSGYAIASVEYRLSPIAPFPAQAHDLKAAIRFLRAHADQYGVDGQRIVIAGASAGAHLATLVGVTGDLAELDGPGEKFPKTSSRVQAIVSFYGASDLRTILAQSTPHGLSVRIPALKLLLTGLPDEQPELARLASPAAHVDAQSPPLLLIHGDADPQMPYVQSQQLWRQYRELGRPTELVTIAGGQHGGPEFFQPAMLARVHQFLQTHLAPTSPGRDGP